MRFEQFRQASGLAEENEVKQVSTLMYCLGEEAEAVLSSTNIKEKERMVYATDLYKLESFFQVRRNVIFERARFNRRNQLEGETAEQYIMELYRMSERCNYGSLTEELMRDSLVVGIRDIKLSERLQLDSELTLVKAKRMVRQAEAVQEQQQQLRVGNDNSCMDEIKPKHKDRTLAAEEDDSCVDEIKPKRKEQGPRGGFGKQKPTSYTSGQFREPKR